MVNNKNITYKIRKDASIDSNYVFFNKIKDGKEFYGIGFASSDRNSWYQKCLNNARDTTGIFPTTLSLKVKPN